MPRKNKETLFKEKVVKLLKQIPYLWVVKTQQVSVRGTPDLLICCKGKFVAWELKTSTGVADPLQTYTLGEIARAMGVARVVTPDNLEKYMEELWQL